MLKKWIFFALLPLMLAMVIFYTVTSHAQLTLQNTDPLPSWNDGPAKKAIIEFVQSTTVKTQSTFVPPNQRFAMFDQDGTLWVEHPIYTQVIFAFDRIVALAPSHPEWKTTEPFKSILHHDQAAMAKFSPKELEQIVMVTHAGMTVDAFAATVKDWLLRAKHPRWHRPYTDLVYQPMLEVLRYLRTNGYKTYIVTGGGQDFVRVYAEQVYGIPPEQVIGSALQTTYSYDKQGKGILSRAAKVLLNDNFSGKPENIYLFIGDRPTAAFGNSTGDQQMLEYTQGQHGKKLMLLVHHDDAVREYSYGPDTKVGTFSNALMSEAGKNGWIVASMKNDWKRIFPFGE